MEIKDYFEKLKAEIVESVKLSKPQIDEIAHFISEIMIDKGVIQLFGYGHDVAFANELGFRAGGLVQFHSMKFDDLVLQGVISQKEEKEGAFLKKQEIIKEFWNLYKIEKEDALLLYVANNVSEFTLSLAKHAKENKMPVILVYSEKALLSDENLEIGKQLISLSDKKLKLNIAYPDVFGIIEGEAIGQEANLVGTVFAQLLVMEIFSYMKSLGKNLDVFWSMNIKGADEHNKNIKKEFEGRIWA